MPVTYTSRTGKRYYLHTGSKRGGGVQHYFSTKTKGTLADAIPEGFEVYETVNGQVYLRRHAPRLITEEEEKYVQERVKQPRGTHRYKLEVRGPIITIHESSQDFSCLNRFGPMKSPAALEQINEQFANYQPIMRFQLVDDRQRLFAPERYCFRGSVDDWISIGAPDKIEKVARAYLKHLGQDSLFELY